MEKPNVNNLNGIPNFGHGFEEEAPEEILEPIEFDEAPKVKKARKSE